MTTTPFVILFEGRSGSTWLVEALRSHPGIDARLEVFASMRKRGYGAEDQLGWAREFLAPSFPDDVEAAGFKTKLRDVLDPDGFAGLLREIAPRVVLLRRKNRIKRIASVFRAMRLHEETGEWNLYEEADRPEAIAIPPDRFDAWLERSDLDLERLEAFVDDLELPTLRLHYEQLLVDRDETLDAVCRFLDVPPVRLRGRAKKNSSDDLREALANFEQLRERYVGTPYASMFDEVLVSASGGS